ncbi:hypothetical protein [Agromyces humi]|uniref:hypothetical protein n=1 Tax=Agromyces humi TaxID=1766800 RepID=UPI00135BDC15|nr:hypothetical protein [Agromyces humi]
MDDTELSQVLIPQIKVGDIVDDWGHGFFERVLDEKVCIATGIHDDIRWATFYEYGQVFTVVSGAELDGLEQAIAEDRAASPVA